MATRFYLNEIWAEEREILNFPPPLFQLKFFFNEKFLFSASFFFLLSESEKSFRLSVQVLGGKIQIQSVKKTQKTSTSD